MTKGFALRSTLMVGASFAALTFGAGTPAMAGNIVLTGHDNDLHCFFGDGNACNALGAEASYVNGGTAKTILVIDENGSSYGLEAAGALSGTGFGAVTTGLGFTVVTKAASAITAADFDNSLYGSVVVASVIDCGGCDNPVGTGTTLSAFSSAIAAFFNAGGGILGLSGSDDPAAYAYVPESGGTTTAIGAASGFVATAAGLSGIPGFLAVNGDQTHNTFAGFSSFYQVAETFGVGGDAVTIFGTGGIISCTVDNSCTIGGGSVPEPTALSLLGAGLFGLGMMRRRRQRKAA